MDRAELTKRKDELMVVFVRDEAKQDCEGESGKPKREIVYIETQIFESLQR